MVISDFLLLVGSVLIWMALMIFSPFFAVWMAFPVMALVCWLVVKTMWEDE